jgi:hypothetical protein
MNYIKKIFVIFAPSYSENNGGSVTLHHLCELINSNGYDCYLYPGFDNIELNILNYKKVLLNFLFKTIREPFRVFKTSKRFKTPVIKEFPGQFKIDDLVVIYPEIVFGNPLSAKNVVRWFLHNPGFFSGKIYYGNYEIYFKYSNSYKSINYLNSITSNNNLYIFTYPKNYYNDNALSANKSGVCYCIRKGKLSSIPFNLQNAILIDGLKHSQISSIFKKSKYFISFDPHTAFSRFAAICGCISIVVPIDGIVEDTWQPDPKKRYGISYGFSNENLQKAIDSVVDLKKEIILEEHNSYYNVRKFVEEVQYFFENKV